MFAATRDLSSDAASLLAIELAPADSQVVIPAALDDVAPADLTALRGTGRLVTRFEAVPHAVYSRHVEAAYHTALRLELAQVAIPMHIQNLKDHVEHKYGLPRIPDALARNLVRGWGNSLEIREDTFQARRRFNDLQTVALLRHWRDLLGTGLWTGIFDLPAYMDMIARWYAPLVEGPAGSPVLLLDDGEHVSLVTSSSRAHFAPVELVERPPALMAPFLGAVDEDLGEELEAQHRLRTTLLSGAYEDPATVLFEYARLWMRYIDRPAVRGQEQKWRGWYLHPEHGELTPAKLRELASILRECERIATRGVILVDRSPAGIENANRLLAAGQVSYRTNYSATQKRDLFTRQQRNYLIRLGLVNERAPSVLDLTDRGILWGAAETDEELAEMLRDALAQLRWSWCNMPFFEFTRTLAEAAEGYVTYAELFSWVIHALAYSQLGEMTAALQAYRLLTPLRQERLFMSISSDLEARLARGGGVGAMGHYSRKIKDMMTAFETSGVFRLEGAGPRMKLALR